MSAFFLWTIYRYQIEKSKSLLLVSMTHNGYIVATLYTPHTAFDTNKKWYSRYDMFVPIAY